MRIRLGMFADAARTVVSPDTERRFGIGVAASVILASFSAKIFNLKKVDQAKIFLGPLEGRAVSCVGVGRLVI